MGHSREKDVMLVRLFGDRPPPSIHNAHRESEKVRYRVATNDDSSDLKPQLPRMETRKLAQGRKEERD